LNFAFVIQAMRHLRQWSWHGRPVGVFLVRAIPVVSFTTVTIVLAAFMLGLPQVKSGMWWARAPLNSEGAERARVQNELERLDGSHLVIVRYEPHYYPKAIEWVYNAADIDGAKVVWAREMGPQEDLKLLRYFAGRHVWLVEPGKTPVRLVPYALPAGP
jgi:hypothetical protein